MRRTRYSPAMLTSAPSAVDKLVGLIVVNAARKQTTSLSIERTAADALVVYYDIDGSFVEEMRPPVKLWQEVMLAAAALGELDDLRPGGSGAFDLVGEDAIQSCTVLVRVARNEYGPTVTMGLKARSS